MSLSPISSPGVALRGLPRSTNPARLVADQTSPREFAREQVAVYSRVNTGAATRIGGVAIPIEDQELGGLELAGQPLSPLDRGSRIPRSPHHQDR